MKSGPDVFADALVPRNVLFPEHSRSQNVLVTRNARFRRSVPMARASGARHRDLPQFILIVRRRRFRRLLRARHHSPIRYPVRRELPNGRRSYVISDHLPEPVIARRVAPAR